MNKKEVSEIKRLFKRDGCAIDRICGCLVDGDKDIRMTFNDSFRLSQEEEDKYFDIFRKSLSGKIGKNLHSLDYTLDQELSGDGHKMLMQLKTTGLKDDSILDEFYNLVAENYKYGESYYVVLIHCNYDVPGRGSDNQELEDASEEVYEFILCCICPVKLSEAGLLYNKQTNHIEERIRDQWIEAPMNAFLFPAFDDRSTNIHSLLYYTKKAEDLHEEFIEGCIGGPTPMSSTAQKVVFKEVVQATAGEGCNYDTVLKIQENLAEMIEKHDEDPEPFKLQKSDVKKLLESSGVNLNAFERVYQELADEDTTFQATNLTDSKSITVDAGVAVIKVDSSRTDLIQPQLVEGRRYIVIPLEGEVIINGICTVPKER